MADDRYAAWYGEKLWQLLPAIYRAEDSDDGGARGPLRELVNRIAAQVAVVRRSVDRLWEDQSIETCDDRLIAYHGDLLATNLVASLDARGRRVDVGKTIYYRRRKGTVAVLEELAGDVTGWSVRVVEGFRRLARHRHGLDPALGAIAPDPTPRGRLQRAQGLYGVHTGTGGGGFADLRSVHGARLADTAFDEFFHTADVRRGRGAVGHHNIPRLVVFVWRLHSLGVVGATPVQDAVCRNHYTFDPTGRDTPLFAAGDRSVGDQWVSPAQHEVPGPISRELLQAAFAALYRSADAAHSIAVYRRVGGPAGLDYDLVTAAEISQDPRRTTGRFAIDPVRGRIIAPVGVSDGEYRVDYHAGFASELGAGPYDRRVPGAPPVAPPDVRVPSDAPGLDAALAAMPATGALGVALDDSRTYPVIRDLPDVTDLTIRATNLCRPVVRSAAPRWVFTGRAPGATLMLDGLLVTGGTEIVLQGDFAHVKLVCCTLDPGSWAGPTWRPAADQRPLAPSRLRLEGHVGLLELERCILGPILDGGAFGAETVRVRDSIVQASAPDEPALALRNGAIALSRCTILGAGVLHRADISESILHGVVTVDDVQHGCVRFTAWTEGSVLPRRYEDVALAPSADLFVSREFGAPGYAQLAAAAGAAILEGAEHGSELGAFAREGGAIKERSILIKFQEYLPLGIEPAIVHVT